MRLGERFSGPDGSANGGYAAGSFAGWAGAVTGGGSDPVEVTLRRPPPLATPLTVARTGSGARINAPDGALVAEVERVEPFSAVVPPVGWQTATAAAADYAGHRDHPFPRCYVCGPERTDGLRIFPGRLPDGRTAAPFEVPADVGPATVWAALDCPGGWSVIAPDLPGPAAGDHPEPAGNRPYVLGRIAAVVTALPTPGDRCVVLGAAVRAEGRKALVHSTLYGPDGALLAYARATWIATRA
ncbi:hypothetical protein O7627_28045 [Solwaraspora sp. WMMD1047]|uniref:hypothetical protein n=1 Tax=Solwaraspora sp. WMMD1047 TaxID=3016102 RepID=UPI002415EC5F|nr:hypothetical protein [Solwaraspora sp. WMMD1047]MDG4833130.1 hypothetical protein [Solwaraspora sp. WMMD1047]